MLKNYAVLFAVVVFISIGLHQCSIINRLESEKNQYFSFNSNQQNNFDFIKKNIAEQKQNILELTKKQQQALIKDEQLRNQIKELQAKISVGVKVLYPPIIFSVDTNKIIKDYIASLSNPDVDSAVYRLALPFKHEYKSDWISFNQDIDTNGLVKYHGIQTKDSIEVYLSEKKKGLKGIFKPKQYVINVLSHNPYSKITGLENIVNKPKLPFFKKPIFLGVFGFGVGILAGVKMSYR